MQKNEAATKKTRTCSKSIFMWANVDFPLHDQNKEEEEEEKEEKEEENEEEAQGTHDEGKIFHLH